MAVREGQNIDVPWLQCLAFRVGLESPTLRCEAGLEAFAAIDDGNAFRPFYEAPAYSALSGGTR